MTPAMSHMAVMTDDTIFTLDKHCSGGALSEIYCISEGGGREGELPWALHVVEPSLLHPRLPRSRASGLVCRVSSASHERVRDHERRERARLI